MDGGRLLRLAAGGVLEHALMYGVFHGDLHSGNVLVTESGDISLVDFGVTGRITARERALLVRLLVASMQQDCRAQVLAAAEFGALPPGRRHRGRGRRARALHRGDAGTSPTRRSRTSTSV